MIQLTERIGVEEVVADHSIRRQELDMMSEVQIHAIARQMLEMHGASAVAQAAQKAQQCEASGEAEEAREWRHIADAMRMMRGPHQS